MNFMRATLFVPEKPYGSETHSWSWDADVLHSPEVLMLTLSFTDGTVVYSFALCAGFYFRMVLQDSRKGLCLFSATLAVVFWVKWNCLEGRGKLLLETWAEGHRAGMEPASVRTNGVAPRRKVLHTYGQASGDKKVVSHGPRRTWRRFLQLRK